MLELGIGADLLRGIGLVLWGILALALLVALFKPKTITGKVLSSLLVLGIFFGPMVPGAIAAHEYRQKYEKAKALFDERCKTAGEKIYKTVENVNGVLLVNTRGNLHSGNTTDRDWEGAGFPGESSDKQYIIEFLYWHTTKGDLEGSLHETRGDLKGYSFVEAKDNENLFRYTLRDPSDFGPPSDPIAGFAFKKAIQTPAARYIVSYENIPDPEGRANWIAGGRVKVIDQKTDEILGEFTRYSFETGFGNTGGERSPWAFARQCLAPSYSREGGHIRRFVEQVIKPSQGN